MRCKIYLIFLLSIVLLGCHSKQPDLSLEKHSEVAELMATNVQLDVCVNEETKKNIEAAYDEVWARLEEIAWRMNVYDDKSDVTKVNNAYIDPVRIELDTYKLLQDSIYFSRLTNGAFDITVKPLINLWKEAKRVGQVPSPEEIARVKIMVGHKNFELMGNQYVRLINSETKIDLGGIAKGYAVDEAARIFREHGFMNFYVEAGGDIYVGGHNCHGEPWKIGIRDPRDLSKIIDVVALKDMAVTTSGNYEQFYEIQGQRWSHILNPITGYPQKGVVSATVIAPTAKDADALSTAMCVLGRVKGNELIDALDAPYASLIIVEEDSNRIVKYASKEYKKNQFKQ